MEPETEQLTLPADPESPPEPPSLEAELAAERDARIRAEAEAAALRSVQSRAPLDTPVKGAPAVTEESIDAAFQAGRIDADTRQRLLEDLRLETKLEQKLTERQTIQRHADAQRKAKDRLEQYVQKFPDLGRNGSELVTRIHATIRELSEDLDLQADDLRTQLLAVEKVCGPMTTSDAPVPSTRIPLRDRPVPRSFGGGSFNANPPKAPEKSKGETLLDAMADGPRDFMIRFRGSREAAIKTLEHASQEHIDKMRRQGRFTRIHAGSSSIE